MVGDDDDPVFVPDLGVLAELAFEDADGARPANIVQMLSPACTRGLPAARARIFSVKVIG